MNKTRVADTDAMECLGRIKVGLQHASGVRYAYLERQDNDPTGKTFLSVRVEMEDGRTISVGIDERELFRRVDAQMPPEGALYEDGSAYLDMMRALLRAEFVALCVSGIRCVLSGAWR